MHVVMFCILEAFYIFYVYYVRMMYSGPVGSMTEKC